MKSHNRITDAAYHLVHDYPGGAEALAPRSGVSSAKVLDNKVNPNSEHHKLSLAEAVRITAFSGDYRILRAWADQENFLLVKQADCLVSDAALLDKYTQLMKELGEFSGVFHDALADGVLTRREWERMETEMDDFMVAARELMARAEQLIDD